MKSNTFYKILKFIQDKLLVVLTNAVTAWLKTQMGGWVMSKVIDFLVGRINEEVIKPFTDVLVIRTAQKFDIIQARAMVKKLELAKEAKDEEEYRRLVDRLIGGL